MIIKFRGKRVIDDTWIYGDLIHSPNGTLNYIRFTTNEQHYLISAGSEGMFTGLYDCTGHEVYKGDILRSFDSKGAEIIHVINYEEESARFIPKYLHNGRLEPQSSGITQQWIKEFSKEVIGNIVDSSNIYY